MERENKYCKLTTEYDKKLKSKVAILKICDKLMEAYKNKTPLNIKVCPFCGKELV